MKDFGSESYMESESTQIKDEECEDDDIFM